MTSEPQRGNRLALTKVRAE